MFFDSSDLALKRTTAIRATPPVPETGWRPSSSYPNLSSAVVLAYDVETYDPELKTKGPGWGRGKSEIVGFSIAAEARNGETGKWYFPIRHRVGGEDNLDPRKALSFAKSVLETPIPKVGANLLYDYGNLTDEGIWPSGPHYDIQFAEAVLDEEAFVGLDVLARKYLGSHKSSDLLYEWSARAYGGNAGSEQRANIFRCPPRLVGHYGEDDAALPLEIFKRQWPLLREQGLVDVFELDCAILPLLVKMRREGVSVDVNFATNLYHELEGDTKSLYERVSHEYGVSLGSTSSAELGRLFDRLGIQYPQTAAGNASIQKEWLKALEHPVGDILNDIREHEKMRGTFLKSYIINGHTGGKLYPQFHPAKGDDNGTKLGRFSSSDPNLQNIPSRSNLGKKIRTAFIPDVGHEKWRKFDYSQIHYRLLANIAIGPGSDELRSKYINDPKTDYHETVQANVLALTGLEIERRPIKNINFGLLYGQSEFALAYKAGFSKSQASGIFSAYHVGAPYVKPSMAMIAEEVQRNGYVTTLLGRRCRFNLWEPNEWNRRDGPRPSGSLEWALSHFGMAIRRAFDYRGVNYKLQGSEPEIMKTGMRTCYESGVFDYTGVPRLTVHDELDFSVRNETPQTREAFNFIQHTMQQALRHKLRIPVFVDETSGPNWGKAD